MATPHQDNAVVSPAPDARSPRHARGTSGGAGPGGRGLGSWFFQEVVDQVVQVALLGGGVEQRGAQVALLA